MTRTAGLDRLGGPAPPLCVEGTCWRVAPARRAAFILDSAAYFRAAKAAMRNATRSILILGWDFDPRVRLEPDNPKPELPDELGPLLERLAAERKELFVHLLIWDMALPMAVPRRWMPRRAPHWFRSERIRYRLDGRHPTGASHHQKIVVVDDAIAFCGGVDFAADRWDTTRHPDRDPRRRTPDGRPYAPHHDVMMAVDGAAAAALGDLARERWRHATGDQLMPPRAQGDRWGDPWPKGLEPDLTDVPVGIARTAPASKRQPGIHEIAALHLRSFAAARRWIYLESQYFASSAVAEVLAARLAEPDGPEVVVLCPVRSPSYFDHLVMDPTRHRLIGQLRAIDRYHRFRAYALRAEGGAPIVVHSKVAIIDDRLLRVGSANLSNRSMGFDTECDLAIESAAGEPGQQAVRGAILGFLDRLLAEHFGETVDRVTATLVRTGSLIATIDAFDRKLGRLQPLEGSEPGPIGSAIAACHLMDPCGMADAWRPWKRFRKARQTLRPGP